MIRRALATGFTAATMVVLAGCGADEERTATPAASEAGPATTSAGATAGPSSEGTVGTPWADPAAGASGGKVGPGTDCPVGLRFDIPAKWKASDSSAMGMAVADTLELVCEIDGKPAGVIGFIRIFADADATTDLHTIGANFVAGWAKDAGDVEFRDSKVGSLNGLEIRYLADGHINRAFVVRPSTATFVVHWGGLDNDEHTAGLPAYILARTTAA